MSLINMGSDSFKKNGLLNDIKDTSYSNNYLELLNYQNTPNTNKLRDCDTQGVLKGILDETLLSNTFFSVDNVQNIQNMIRYYFYQEKNAVISEQSNNELLTIMRGIYLKYSNASANNIEKVKREVKELNNIVTQYSLKQIYINYDNYNRYLDDMQSLPELIDLPKIPDRNINQFDPSLRNDMS